MANFFNDQFELFLGAISGIAGGVFGWLVGRKKNIAETTGLELDNIRTVLGIHKEELKDLRANLIKTREDLTHCRDEMEKILNERLKNLKKG